GRKAEDSATISEPRDDPGVRVRFGRSRGGSRRPCQSSYPCGCGPGTLASDAQDNAWCIFADDATMIGRASSDTGRERKGQSSCRFLACSLSFLLPVHVIEAVDGRRRESHQVAMERDGSRVA